ncbi:MAG: hypothetical protein HQK79_12945 [Desulfobacterales bacterium]|nr:hypothetical protein [Desulfobacterales bacterium]
MTTYLTEETNELIEAIEKDDIKGVCEEAGDVLFLALFIVNLFEEKGDFNLSDVCNLNVEKMIRRHPHVFGNEKAKDADEVIEKWKKIKIKEKEGTLLN